MPIVHLTQSNLHTLSCPANKTRIEYVCQDTPGFYIEMRRSSPGRGTYYYRYRKPSGGNAHILIGHTDDTTLTDARAKARAIKSQIKGGGNPNVRDLTPTAEPTFGQYLTNTYLPHAKKHKRSWHHDDSMMRVKLIPRFGEKLLSQLSRQQIQVFHAELLDEGLSPATCDHYIKLIRHSLNLAVDWGLLEKNPVAKIQLYRADNRIERLLSDAEFKRLIQVLNTDANRMVCKVCLFLLSTGARLNEALGATWSQIDVGNKVWRIPAKNSKSKRIRSVPLNTAALSVLESIQSEGTMKYVFTSSATGDRFVAINKVWHRLRSEAGLPDLRLHDLRHQYASLLVNSGRSLYEVQQILGHSSPIVTQRYAHLSSRALQEAAESASLKIGEVR